MTRIIDPARKFEDYRKNCGYIEGEEMSFTTQLDDLNGNK